VSVANAICFTRGRVKFYDPSGEEAAPTQGQAFFYIGSDVGLFAREFAAVGYVMSCRFGTASPANPTLPPPGLPEPGELPLSEPSADRSSKSDRAGRCRPAALLSGRPFYF
jgi:hypothetical protein